MARATAKSARVRAKALAWKRLTGQVITRTDVGLEPRWTQRTPEERAQILATPITFHHYGGSGWGGRRFTTAMGERGRRVRTPSYDSFDGAVDNAAAVQEGDE